MSGKSMVSSKMHTLELRKSIKYIVYGRHFHTMDSHIFPVFKISCTVVIHTHHDHACGK